MSQLSKLEGVSHPVLLENLSISFENQKIEIVMRYQETQLFQILETSEFSEEQIQSVTAQIFGALRWLHARNFVHGAVSSLNTFVSLNSTKIEVKMTDYGEIN
jgi:serine/threonine protein kinase